MLDSTDTAFVCANVLAVDWRLLMGALDASEQQVLVTNRKGRIVFANLSLAERHGRVRDELIGESIEFIIDRKSVV